METMAMKIFHFKLRPGKSDCAENERGSEDERRKNADVHV